MVQAIHCTVASPQRAWRLGTAATGSPGLMTGQSFGVAPPWPLLQGNWEQVLLHLCLEELNLLPRTSFIPHPSPSPTPAHSPIPTRQAILKGAGSFSRNL